VEWAGPHAVIKVSKTVLDLDGLHAKARQRVEDALQRARAAFDRSDIMSQLKRLQARRAAVAARAVAARAGLELAEREHLAAIGEDADPAKAWAAVEAARSALAGDERQLHELESRLADAQTVARKELNAALAQAVDGLRADLQREQAELRERVTKALAPILPALRVAEQIALALQGPSTLGPFLGLPLE
jgi:hypothetical protein